MHVAPAVRSYLGKHQTRSTVPPLQGAWTGHSGLAAVTRAPFITLLQQAPLYPDVTVTTHVQRHRPSQGGGGSASDGVYPIKSHSHRGFHILEAARPKRDIWRKEEDCSQWPSVLSLVPQMVSNVKTWLARKKVRTELALAALSWASRSHGAFLVQTAETSLVQAGLVSGDSGILGESASFP